MWLRFFELPNPQNCGGAIPIFYADRFVPIKKVDTDISIFTKMLDKVTVKDPVV